MKSKQRAPPCISYWNSISHSVILGSALLKQRDRMVLTFLYQLPGAVVVNTVERSSVAKQSSLLVYGSPPVWPMSMLDVCPFVTWNTVFDMIRE